MIVTHKINMNLDRAGVMPRVDVVQGDANTREIQFSLFSGGQAWEIPADAQVLVRYRKASGAGGTYDTLPNAASASVVSGNTVIITLAPQVVTEAGSVSLAVTLVKGEDELSTFAVLLNVMKNPTAATDDDGNYVSVAGMIPGPKSAKVGQYLEVLSADESGKITAMKAVDKPTGSSDSSQNAGLSTAQIVALDGMFQIVAFSADPTAAYAVFKAAFAQSDSGDSGSGDNSGGETVTTYTVTKNLTNVSSNNDSASVTSGTSYAATLTAADGYVLDAVTVTMGGADITSTVYADGVVNIAAVTGNVVITASAVVEEPEESETWKNLIADVEFKAVTATEYGLGMTYGNMSTEKVTIPAGTYYLYDIHKTAAGARPAMYTEADDGTLSTITALTVTDNNGLFKNGGDDGYGNETSGTYQPNGGGYMVEYTMVLTEDFTGYLWLNSGSYVLTEPGYTWMFAKQYNPHKDNLVIE